LRVEIHIGVLRNYGWTKTRGDGERINAILLTKGHVVDATNELTKKLLKYKMATYDTWLNVLSGISQGSFDQIYLRDASGNFVDIRTLIAAGGSGGGGTVTSSLLPLSIVAGQISLDLSGFCTAATAPLQLQNGLLTLTASYIPTSHECFKIGTSDVAFGAFDMGARTVTLTNASGVSKVVSVDNSGYLNVGADGVITVPVLNLWDHLQLRLKDAAGNVRLLTSTNTGALTWDGSTVAMGSDITAALTSYPTIVYMNNQISITLSVYVTNAALNVALAAYTDTAALNILLNAKQNSLTPGTGLTISNNTISLDGTENRSQLNLIDSGNVVRSLIPSITGGLTYNGSALVDVTYLSTNFSTTSSIAIQLAAKQDSITAGTGLTLSGATLDTYGLRWNVNGVPSTTIHDLHFEWGLDITEALNLTNGRTEVQIRHPSAHPVSMITGLQAELDKVIDMVDGPSGISLGTGTGASQRIAIYEIPTTGAYTAGHFFYGLSLFEGGGAGLGTGLAFWGGSGTALPDQFGTSGTLPHMLLSTAGYIGIGNRNPSEMLHVSGNILATGTITGSSKSFSIVHPDPVKAQDGYHLRHWSVETADCPGGLVMYRRTVEMTSTTATLQMPDWFSHLVKDVTVHVTPFQHFGSAWGECSGTTIQLHATTLGKWHVLIMAARKDDCAVNHCPQQVEFIPATPPESTGMP